MTCLWEALALRRDALPSHFHGRHGAVALADLAAGSMFADSADSLRGRCVLIATGEQMGTALALLELDGLVRRMVLCTPDLSPSQLSSVAQIAGADTIVTDASSQPGSAVLPDTRPMNPRPTPGRAVRRRGEATEWVLLTSGTTGEPKLVVHTLESLAAALRGNRSAADRTVWSTFYDIRRYGGLQIYLRAVLGGASLALSSAAESMENFFARAVAVRVTHISGTPSHWRRALMSGAAGGLRPEYVRLSGEVADQPLLDALRVAYPAARIGHAFASTEAGVAFDVDDGFAGIPAAYLDRRGDVDMKVELGTLRIRSRGNAARYLGESPPRIAAADGFVDTGDLVELVDGRYHFRGRRGGVINVGGLKVYPEEVEAVLNADPRVHMSLVRARRSPITGAVVAAEVVLVAGIDTVSDPSLAERVKSELLGSCRRVLPPHKVPATLRLVPALEVTTAGKLVRRDA